MDTPVFDFTENYRKKQPIRLHMPGHKGILNLGLEANDITEISGADSLYTASGIIRQSEENASRIFGCKTFYSAEGSSLCVRAMLYLLLAYARSRNQKPVIAAGRNVHKTFVTASALLDLDVIWLRGRGSAYLSCDISPDEVESVLKNASQRPLAIYLTAPDYLGNRCDISAISEICRKYGVILLVDNAHGAYLKFLPQSQHPIDLGADICCDSAHKTLPALTGGAYLHISHSAPAIFSELAKEALAFFGSTSPSYLILQSLDKLNGYLTRYPEKLASYILKIEKLKAAVSQLGYSICGSEPLKLTLRTKSFGYTGEAFAQRLEEHGVYCEFSDPDFVVMMFTPEIEEEAIRKLYEILKNIPQKPPIESRPPSFYLPERVMSVRDAALSPSIRIPAENSLGRIVAAVSVSCPPAVPIVMCGERVDEAALESFRYYGVEKISVVK